VKSLNKEQLERLDRWMDAYLDEALIAEEAAELSRELIRSPEARRRFWQLAAMHGVLPEAVQLQWLSQAAPEAASKVVAMPSSLANGRRHLFPIAIWAAAACAMLAAVWWATAQPWWPAGKNFARIARAPGAVWENRGALAKGTALAQGRFHLTSGAVELHFRSGAQLVVEAPAEIELLGRNEARVFSGQCSAFVPPEAHGFRIEAPGLSLVDLGTAFGLKVPPSGPVEAHVFEGEVQVSNQIGKTVHLVEGEAVQALESGFDPIPVRSDLFLTSERLAARESLNALRKIDRWRATAERLSRDRDTLIHFTCEDQQPWDTLLRNDARQTAADARTGIIIGATRAEGRWPGKSALAFRQTGDRVRFEAPGKFPSLTLVASIYVDNLSHDFNALLMTENLAPGDLRWQLLKDGRLQLGVRTGAGNEARPAEGRSFEAVATPPIIDRTSLGRWMTVATVYDSVTGTISHYVDGTPVASQQISKGTPAFLGALELGNWGIQLDDPKWTWTKDRGPSFTQRNFEGRIDQFALIRRALTAREVEEYSASW
jgi:hypothetical protein